MTRSSSITPAVRLAATTAGVLVALGLGQGGPPALAQAASPVTASSTEVVPASPSVTPALPPTDPRYILARLDSEYLIEIARDWYAAGTDDGGTDGASPVP